VQANVGTKRAHALDLERIGVDAGEDDGACAATAAGIGHGLPEVARTGADDGSPGGQPLGKE
jgi:hypothetical protein